MRIIRMVAAILVVGMMARAEQHVTVYVSEDMVTRGALYQAQERAAQAFAVAGVRVDWHTGRPSAAQLEREHPIWITIADRTPADHFPAALASAQVYDGVHITVFWDRIAVKSRLAPTVVVLAHVLVHEITHILQRIDRHSDSGVMKEHWTAEDYRAMASKPLPFTPFDVELIQRGAALRPGSRPMAASNSAQTIVN